MVSLLSLRSRVCVVTSDCMFNSHLPNDEQCWLPLHGPHDHYFMKPLFSFAYFYRFYWFFSCSLYDIRLFYTFCVHALYQIYRQYFLLVCDFLVHFLKDGFPITEVFHRCKVQIPIAPVDDLFGLCPVWEISLCQHCECLLALSSIALVFIGTSVMHFELLTWTNWEWVKVHSLMKINSCSSDMARISLMELLRHFYRKSTGHMRECIS